MIKKLFKFLGFVLLMLIIILIVKTVAIKSRQISVETVAELNLSEDVVDHLIQAIRIFTVSFEDETKIDSSKFLEFHQLLAENYPLVHSNLQKKKFNRYGLLFKWNGIDPDLNPIVLMAHQDVVPVVEDEWQTDPFSGENDGTFVWGRGTLDDKGALISILEAVEKNLEEGFQPKRTIYLAFGNDEEIGGKGAQSIAKHLEENGVDAEFILDEGLVITRGIVPMIEKPVAVIGTSEKGYLSVELSCEIEGGHSSTPQKETAIYLLSNAIVKLIDNQLDPRISIPVDNFLDYIGPEIPWPARIVFANKWLLSGLIKKIYSGSAAGDALVRTTTAPTIFQGGIKDNVLPTRAKAVINYRLLPGDESDEVLDHLCDVIDDERISVKKVGFLHEAAPVSDVNTLGFEILHKTIKQQYPEVIVAPTLMLGASDSWHYSAVSKNIFRFAPYNLSSEDLSRIHGNNERISIDDYKKMIGFYFHLIRNFSL